MRRIAVVTDSTAVINENIKGKYDNLYIIPLHIIFGDESFKDLEITSEEFFNKINTSNVIPSTSQPAVGKVIDLFDSIKDEYDHIIYITISSGISGTYSTGVLAKNEVSDNITVFDSSFTSVVQEYMVSEALRMIDEGNDIIDINKHLEVLRDNSNVILVVDDLKHMNRTGRISIAQASIGGLLKLKPVLEFSEGKVIVKKKIRTIKKAHNHLVDLVKEAELNDDSKLMIAHAKGLEDALKLRTELNKIHPNLEINISELSPVISLHSGPNTVGVAWCK